MKIIKTIAISLLVGSVSFTAMAAKEVTKEEVKTMNLEKIGTVTTNGKATSPMDAKKDLSQKADEKGGKYYLIIAGREHGKFNATADVYK